MKYFVRFELPSHPKPSIHRVRPTRFELDATWRLLLCRASSKQENIRHVVTQWNQVGQTLCIGGSDPILTLLPPSLFFIHTGGAFHHLSPDVFSPIQTQHPGDRLRQAQGPLRGAECNHEALLNDHENLVQLHETLSTEYESLDSEHGTLKSHYRHLKGELQDVQHKCQVRFEGGCVMWSDGYSIKHCKKDSVDFWTWAYLKNLCNNPPEKKWRKISMLATQKLIDKYFFFNLSHEVKTYVMLWKFMLFSIVNKPCI